MHPRVRLATQATAVSAAVLTFAACSSSASSSGDQSSAAKSTSNVDYAAQMKALELVEPDQFKGPTTPVKVPSGIKIAAISSSQTLEGDVDAAAGIAQAAKAIGWTERTFDGQGSTTTQSNVIAAAVSWGAKVIVLVAVNPVGVQTGLNIAKKAGVLIVAADGATGDFSPNPVKPAPAGDVWPTVEISPEDALTGTQMGRWIVADSQGSAHTLVLADKEFSGAIIGPQNALKVLQACSGCQTGPIVDFTSDQIASSLGPEVVSYLRTHTDVNYILVPYDPAVTAVVTAMRGAGLASGVKIVSNLGDQPNLKYIAAGTVQAADYAWDANYIGWATVDQTIRSLDNKPVFEPNDEHTPTVVLTKDNLGNAADSTSGWQAPFDYKSKFLALWQH